MCPTTILKLVYWTCFSFEIAAGLRFETFLNRTIAVCPDASCQGSCYHTRSAEDNCHCDDICELYGDCCYDFWTLCSNDTLDMLREDDVVPSRLKCRSISGHHCQVSIKMVNVCPPTFQQALVKERCTSNSLGLMEPVFGSRGYIYANKFCAQCHREFSKDLIPLAKTLQCPETQIVFELFQNLTMDDDVRWFELQFLCHHNITLPQSLKGRVRYCSLERDYSDPCAKHEGKFESNAEQKFLSRTCNTYQGFVTLEDDRWQYKNSHCALCTGVNLSEQNTSCPIRSRRVKRQQCFTGPGPITGPSFSVLLDFNNDFHVGVIGTTVSCPHGQTFDSVSDTCKVLSCSHGYRLIGTRCVLIENTDTFLHITVSLDYHPQADGRVPVSEERVRDLLNDHQLFGNFTYEVSKKVGNSRRVMMKFTADAGRPVLDGAEKGLMFCSRFVNESKAMPMWTSAAFQCDILSGREDAESPCAEEVDNYNTFTDVRDSGFDYASIIQVYKGNGFMFNSSFSVTETFNGKASHVTAKMSARHCSHSPLECPLIEVGASNIDTRNRTHLILFSGESYKLGDFQIMGNRTYICSELRGNVSEYTTPMFTIQLGFDAVHYYMTMVGLSLSVAGLTLTLIVYMVLEQLRTVPGKILMNLTLSLLLAQFFFLFGAGKTQWTQFCVANAALEHYLWLVSFFWMNVISLDLAKTFMTSALQSHDDRGRSLLIGYSIYSWGLPLLHVITCFLIDYYNVIPDQQLKYASSVACFLSGYEGMLFAFVLPLTIIMAINIVCFFGVIVMLTKASSLEKKIQKNRIKRNQLFLSAKLIPITGLTWTFGVVATFSKIAFFWNPFIIFNSLQGVFVFCAFVLNCRVKGMLKAKFVPVYHDGTGTSNTRF